MIPDPEQSLIIGYSPKYKNDVSTLSVARFDGSVLRIVNIIRGKAADRLIKQLNEYKDGE